MATTTIHPDTPRALTERNINPTTPAVTPTTTSMKRKPGVGAVGSSHTSPNSKRVKISTPTPDHFKMPALPTRALTPSTSTAAYSSSPRPLPSSPPPPATTSRGSGQGQGHGQGGGGGKVRVRDVAIDSKRLSPGTALIFGRHRHGHSGQTSTTTSSSSSSSTTTLRSAVPNHLAHLVHNLDNPAEIVFLPRSAKHASRVHAVAEYLEESDGVRVTVIGQNGLRLKNGRRILPGQRFEFARTDDHEISFYGASVRLEFPEVATKGQKRDLERLFKPPLEGNEAARKEEVEEDREVESSLPPSSPPLRRASTPLSEAEPEPEPEPEPEVEALNVKEVEVASSRDGSPVPTSKGKKSKSATPAPTPKPSEAPARPPQDASKSSSLSKLPQGETSREVETKPSTTVSASTLPSPKLQQGETVDESAKAPDVDLPALLASTVVFSGSSKLSLPDLVKHMLESQPSLRTSGNEAQWGFWCGQVLESNAMFGKVQRHGKDASGRPLQPHYFYNPDLDSDISRAKELGGLVRPLRTVQRAGGKAIDWRPVGGGRRRY